MEDHDKTGMSTKTQIRGAPRKRYKIQLRRQLRAADIHEVDWETQAQDRDNWRAAIKEGVKLFEQNRREVTEGKRRRRKERKKQPHPLQPLASPAQDAGESAKQEWDFTASLRRCQQKWNRTFFPFILGSRNIPSPLRVDSKLSNFTENLKILLIAPTNFRTKSNDLSPFFNIALEAFMFVNVT